MLPYTLGGDRRLRRYASALDASTNYRVLRRLPRLEEMWMTSMPHGPVSYTHLTLPTKA